MDVLVLDGHLKSALAVTRALGRAGYSVVVGSDRAITMAGGSRYATDSFVYPSPKTKQREFIASVIAAAHGSLPVVYTFSDATTLSLARARDTWKELLLMPLPGVAEMEVGFDKARVYEIAKELRIPTIPAPTDYPRVLKPRHSLVWVDGRPAGGTAEMVVDEKQRDAVAARIEQTTNESPLEQTLIVGTEYGFEAMCREGHVVQGFAHKRIRALSPRGGAAVVKETATDHEVVNSMREYATRLLRELRWTGPAMVEFKQDSTTGTVYLMELNGRFWGSLPLPQRAGVNFAWQYHQIAHNQPIESTTSHSIRTRHFLGDCKWLWDLLFNSDPMRSRLYPSRWTALLDFTLEIVRSRGDIWQWSDPLPALYEILQIIKK